MARDNCKLNNQDVLEELNAKEVHDADILDKTLSCVGGMGRYQKLMFLAMIPIGILFAFTYTTQLFITLTPQNYWCIVPKLANLSMELRRNLSAPGAITGDWDHCMTFDTNWTHVLETLTPPPNGTNLISCTHGWEFEFDDIPYETVVTERQWVCERASYVPTAQSVFFIGSVIGTFIFGCIADRFGRIPAIVGTNLMSAVAGIATTFTTGFWDFMICRFIVGLSFDGCFLIAYILFSEYLGPEYRTLVGNLTLAFGNGFGTALIPWLALYIADWRKFLWVTSSPGFFVLALAWFLPESIRWLLSRGCTCKAVKILTRFEYINGRTIPDDVLDELILSFNKEKQEDNKSLLSLFKSPPLLGAMISLIVLFMGVGMVIDGLMRLSGSFGMPFFHVFSFNAITEITSTLFVAILLDRWGRRALTGISLLVCGTALVSALFLAEGLPRVSVSIVARLLIAMCYASTIQWSTEILPTPVRASANSVLHMSLLLSAMISPFIVFSEHLWKMLPLLIYAVIAFLAAGATLILPETNGMPLTQTLADGEKIIRERSLCGKRIYADGFTCTRSQYEDFKG